MIIQSLHKNFTIPTKGSDRAGAYDIYMPEAGAVDDRVSMIGLGFAAAVPLNHVALLLPRSSTGSAYGLELNNSCGVIDSDYRGEWKAALRTKSGLRLSWNVKDRILQFLIVPAASVELQLVDSLDETERGTGGFGSTGQ